MYVRNKSVIYIKEDKMNMKRVYRPGILEFIPNFLITSMENLVFERRVIRLCANTGESFLSLF